MKKRHGFTLVELLVVVAIIFLLAGMVMPSLDRAFFAAHRAACLNNLKQWGVASLLFAKDHRGRVPRGIDWYAEADGTAGPTSKNPNWDISDYYWGEGAGGWTGSCHPRGPNLSISYGGVGTWRMGENGVLAALGYFSDAGLLYCPGSLKPTPGDGNDAYYLDRSDVYHNSTPMSQYWDALIENNGLTKLFGDSACKASYVHFLFGLRHTQLNTPASFPVDLTTAMIETHWFSPTFNEIARRYRGDTQQNRDYSPLMWACASGGGLIPHGPYEQQGCNGVMYDGSARWIGRPELFQLVDIWNAANGQSLPYYGTGGSYGYDRFANLGEGSDGMSYSGDKVQMQILVRYGLELASPD